MKWVKLCYNDIESCVVNNLTSCAYFNIKRGVRQGDPLSPYLFILAAEIMSIHIRNDKDIHGIMCNGRDIKVVTYADDTTALLNNINDATKLFDFLKKFEKFSGLRVNRSKTEGLWLGCERHSNYKPLGIKWTSVVKILGKDISNDKDEMLRLNCTT